jgi:presequence protease
MYFKIVLLSFLLLAINNCTNINSFDGYKTIKTSHVDSISSDVVELVHNKSGASIVLIKNKDQATSFMAGFRTPPYDDTGLFHIFEHAVLEGSRLYPSKSNFFHLANSSVASFINAMTGSIYTLYPFVTRSSLDFDNLMSVYMDAVFFPKVVSDPRIIRREGWRFETDEKLKKMTINGIVLSEMKGAFSSPYRSLWFQLSRSLLPDTPYSYSSGGLPDKIATLTFEQIVEAHKKYYHPQNSIIFLYGDLDYKKQLAKIDTDYLSHFEKQKDYIRPEIQLQKNITYPTKIVESTYPGEKGDNKDFLAKGYIIGQGLTKDEENALSILTQAFAGNDTAPLKLRILKENLAKSVFFMGLEGKDNGASFVFEGSIADNKEKIEKVLEEELEKVSKEGLDPELLTSILNKYEFSFKEKNSNGSHRGMQLGSIVLDQWINQDEPLTEALDFVSQFKRVRVLLDDKNFVKTFFKTHFLENNRNRWVILKPDPDFSKKFNSGLDLLIEKALKDKPLSEYSKEFNEYQEWVSMKESPEILATTPTLKLKDIIPDEPAIEVKTDKIDNTTLLKYPQDTNGITYINLYFDLQGVDKENLKNLELFSDFISTTDTSNYPFIKLSKEIDTYIGNINFSVNAFQSVKNPQNFKPTMAVGLRFLNENTDKTFELTQELLTQSLFSPLDRLQNLIEETVSSMQSGISGRAPGLSSNAASKHFYPQLGGFVDETSGASFESYILKSKLKPETIQLNLQKLLKDIFNQNRLYLTTVASSKNDIDPMVEKIKDLKSKLNSEKTENQVWNFENQPNYDGFIIPGEVQYVTQASSFADQDIKYNGAMVVYSQFLNSQFMTPRLREQAGAYGAWASFSPSGIFKMSTYKDPNLKVSLNIFSEAINYMKSEKLNQDDLLPAILGSLKSYYKDTSLPEKSAMMTGLYLSEQTWDDYMKIKKEILNTTVDDFGKITKEIDLAFKKSYITVSGSAEKIKSEAPFLKNKLDLR